MNAFDTNRTVIFNANVVLTDRVAAGALVFDQDGIIEFREESHAAQSPVGMTSIDAQGAYVIPGLVEVHTDALEWHLRPRPQSVWPAAAAVMAHDAVLAASGITTVLDSLCIGDLGGDGFRADVLQDALEAIESAQNRGAFRIEHFLHLRCEVADSRTPQLFDREVTRERVRLVSLMDHTPGVRQYRNMEVYRKAMLSAEENRSEELLNSKIAMLQSRRTQFSLPNWKYIAAVVNEMGIALASHDDATPEDVALAVGTGVTISEFPTTLEAAVAARNAGLLTAAGAPNVVRGGSHSGNVRAVDLASAGVLDILTSDYVPYSLLHAPFLLAEQGVLPLPEAIRLVTVAPAQSVGLMDRGSLEPGKRADVVMVRVTGGVPGVEGVWSSGRRVA